AVSPRLPAERGEVLAVVFTSVDCPIGNAMAPQLHRTLARAREQGVATYLVYPRSGLALDRAAEHARDYRLEGTILLDPDKQLVERFDARITPEGLVLECVGPDRFQVRYRGRINDLYASIGNRREQPSRHDFREAITLACEGRPVPEPHPPAIGCRIERVP
ncbi:MAG: hypothetical protein VXY94_01770, partial [Planctomycetota bacterium]|nr:hypothetical protein [Planctomycetota bacterium]